MRNKMTFLVFLVLLIIIGFLFIPFKIALVFYEENTSNQIAFLPLNKGDTFQIIFTHSIHLKDVVEKYRVTEGLTIEQYEIIYEEFGIGMPSNAEEGATFEYKDGKYHITGLNNVFSSMNIRNGKTVSKHRLVWKYKNSDEEHIVRFNDYFEPGAWYRVVVQRISLWGYLKGEKIHE
ncbi:DUF1850 domain-containing protein [Bacillaceae bacterium S4-13-58]